MCEVLFKEAVGTVSKRVSQVKTPRSAGASFLGWEGSGQRGMKQ